MPTCAGIWKSCWFVCLPCLLCFLAFDRRDRREQRQFGRFEIGHQVRATVQEGLLRVGGGATKPPCRQRQPRTTSRADTASAIAVVASSARRSARRLPADVVDRYAPAGCKNWAALLAGRQTREGGYQCSHRMDRLYASHLPVVPR